MRTDGARESGADSRSGATSEPSGDGFTKHKSAWLEAVALDIDLSHFAARVAAVIGTHLNRSTWEAFPGQERLAEQLGATRRGIQGAIEQLVAGGHMQVIPSPNRRGGNSYRPLLKGSEASPSSRSGDTADGLSHANRRAHGDGSHANRGAHEKPSHANGGAHENGPHANGHDSFMRTAVRTNHLREPLEGSAAVQPRRGGGGRGGEDSGQEAGRHTGRPAVAPSDRSHPGDAPDGVSDLVDFDPPPAAVDAYAARSRREAEWRRLLATEPVVVDPDASALHRLVDDGEVTEADAVAGIREALGKPDFRPRHWRSLAGWARGAAKNRLAGSARPGPGDDRGVGPIEPTSAPLDPARYVRVGSEVHSAERVRAQCEAYRQTGTWSFELGLPPDDPHTELPIEFRCEPRKTLKNTVEDGTSHPRDTGQTAV